VGGDDASFWLASEYDADGASSRYFFDDGASVGGASVGRSLDYKTHGFSLRCLED